MSFQSTSFGSKSDHRHSAGAIPLDVVAERLTDEANRNHGTFVVRDEWFDVHGILDVIDVVGGTTHPDPHRHVALGELDAVIGADPLHRETQSFSKGPNRHHRPVVYNIGLLIREGNISAVEGDLEGAVTVVVQIYFFAVGDQGIFVLGGISLERRSAGDGREVVFGLVGENSTESIARFDEEFSTVRVYLGVIDPQTIDENLRRCLLVGIGGNVRLIRIDRDRGAVSVNIQSAFALCPSVAKEIGPITHDKPSAGGEVDTAVGELRVENLAHIVLSLDADLVFAIDIGVDAIHSGVVHIDGGGANIQVNVGGGGSGAGQQTKHHDDRHQGRNKPCFFHCTFLQYNIVFCGAEMCGARDEKCYVLVLLYILNAKEVIKHELHLRCGSSNSETHH